MAIGSNKSVYVELMIMEFDVFPLWFYLTSILLIR